MARPIKERSIANMPSCSTFLPMLKSPLEPIILRLDEFEVIRNCDYLRLSQDNCAKIMNVSRTTVQRLYADARMKLADVIVNGRSLEIEGGMVNFDQIRSDGFKNEKGELNMKLAIGLDGTQVSNHFGHCNDFRIFEIIDNKIMNQNDIHEDTQTHHLRPKFLKDLGVDVLIMNGIGKGAYNRLIDLNINCVFAENKSVDEAVSSYLNHMLTQPIEAHECSNCSSEGHTHG